MTIEAVLIVKNEEEMLARCLDSLKGIDSIVIVDTGSTDKTIEIARKYTDKIYHFKWVDSFCKARNFAKSKATGGWILSIDADEYLNTPLEKVRKVIEETNEDLLNVKVTGEKGGTHIFPRLFKNSKDIFWKGDIHNYLNRRATVNSDIEIIYGYSPAHKKDPDRALRILKKSVKEDSVRERYYLAREYFYRKMWQECIDELEKYFKVARWLPEKNDAYLLKARCLSGLKRYGEACDSAWEALKYNANFSEVLEFIGNHMDATNKQRWLQFANLADDSNVLFVRKKNIKPMDMAQVHIDYFKRLLKEYKKVDVLEWGSGYSTRYFPEFMQKEGIEYTWKAIEHNPYWASVVASWGVKNVSLTLADKDSKEYLEPSGRYDIIFVDGRNRSQCLKNAKKLLKKGGVVLLHDAQRKRYQEGMEGYQGELIGLDMRNLEKNMPRLWKGTRDIIK